MPLKPPSTNAVPRPVQRWTAWPAISDDGVEMARVRLDFGQHSFAAGAQIAVDQSDFAEKVARLIEAIRQHFKERGLL